jgi:phospholipase C
MLERDSPMTDNKPRDEYHPGWDSLSQKLADHVLSRRRFIPAAAAAAGGLALGLSPLPATPARAAGAAADKANWPTSNKIKHVVILCQENRSFDHYFGAFANSFGKGDKRALGFEPSQLTYYNADGKAFHPRHLTQYCGADPDHSWEGSHAKWNNGAMDGFVAEENGATYAIDYFDRKDHIYHVQLAHAFTLGDHYFCSQIGPTLPNRLYLWSGTSGWDYLNPTETANSLPYNNPSLTQVPPSLTWPTMADVLSAAGLPWKCYSVADGSVPSAIGAFNPLIFFPSIMNDPLKLAAATAEIQEFFLDLKLGTLPAVSWLVTEAVVSEHPPAPPDMGQLFAARVVQELMNSSAWESTALFLVYDEGGGFFEHVAPEILEYVPENLPDPGDAVGLGFRVPMTIVSPWVRPGTVYKNITDHTSVLQFIERTFSTQDNPVYLPTINAERRTLASLEHAFDFNQQPIQPVLPTAADLYPDAQKLILTLNLDHTIAQCSEDIPDWLPPLLGV